MGTPWNYVLRGGSTIYFHQQVPSISLQGRPIQCKWTQVNLCHDGAQAQAAHQVYCANRANLIAEGFFGLLDLRSFFLLLIHWNYIFEGNASRNCRYVPCRHTHVPLPQMPTTYFHKSESNQSVFFNGLLTLASCRCYFRERLTWLSRGQSTTMVIAVSLIYIQHDEWDWHRCLISTLDNLRHSSKYMFLQWIWQ